MVARVRTLVVAVLITGYALVVGPVGLLLAWLLGSPSLLFRLALPAARLALWLSGVRFRVVGLDRLDGGANYLFMPNHNSNLDPPLVLLALGRDARMMAKAPLFRIPMLGQLLTLTGFVPVLRDRRDEAIRAVGDAARLLRDGVDFVVFPEGTRSPDGTLLPLKKGPFFMALDGGVPVVPVRILGTAPLLPKGGLVIRAGDAVVEILEPIRTVFDGYDDPEARRILRDRVTDALTGDLVDSADGET